MPNRTTDRLTAAQFVTSMTNQMDRMARTLSTWTRQHRDRPSAVGGRNP